MKTKMINSDGDRAAGGEWGWGRDRAWEVRSACGMGVQGGVRL